MVYRAARCKAIPTCHTSTSAASSVSAILADPGRIQRLTSFAADFGADDPVNFALGFALYIILFMGATFGLSWLIVQYGVLASLSGVALLIIAIFFAYNGIRIAQRHRRTRQDRIGGEEHTSSPSNESLFDDTSPYGRLPAYVGMPSDVLQSGGSAKPSVTSVV